MKDPAGRGQSGLKGGAASRVGRASALNQGSGLHVGPGARLLRGPTSPGARPLHRAATQQSEGGKAP